MKTMFEKRRLKRESIKNTALFFVAFALVFTLLGMFVYQTMSANIFRVVDEQILLVPSDEAAPASLGDPSSSTEDAYPLDGEALGYSDIIGADESGQIVESSIEDNPQTIALLRNSAGELIDTFGIYADYPESIKTMPFDDTLFDTVYALEHNGHRYRAVNYIVQGTTAGSEEIMQFIANVDSETAILDNFTKTLVGGLALALVVSAAVSYALSRKTLKPIASAWERQTEFVQNASHELRTPLTVIKTTQELLLEHPNDRIVDRFEDISVTIEETERLSRLAEELLVLTSLDCGADGLRKKPLDLDKTVFATASTYRDFIELQGKTLALDLASDATVEADEDKIRQLLAILLDNAIKYTDAGGSISIRTSQRGATASICVADTGTGVAPEDAAHVFDRFYRADKARSRETGGNGLGLSIARGIVDAHKGTIRLEPNQGRGVSVFITLPA